MNSHLAKNLRSEYKNLEAGLPQICSFRTKPNHASKKSNKPNSSRSISIPDFQEQLEIQKNLLQFQSRFNLIIEQKNGQRILRSASLKENTLPPGPNCEVFVAKVPKDVFEDTIYPIFGRVGKIYEIRLMMNFSGLNRGYCFIMYDSPRAAQRAIKELDQYEIYPGCPIGVVESIDHCRLKLQGFPKDMNTHALVEELFQVSPKINHILVYTSDKNGSIMCVILCFNTHRDAAMARRCLLPGQKHPVRAMNGVHVTWAHPDFQIFNGIQERCFRNTNDQITIVRSKIEEPERRKLKSKKENGMINHDSGYSSRSDDSSLSDYAKEPCTQRYIEPSSDCIPMKFPWAIFQNMGQINNFKINAYPNRLPQGNINFTPFPKPHLCYFNNFV